MSSNNNITNPKRSNCKCFFTPTVKSSGQPFKTCDKCRTVKKESNTKNKCEHDKRKDRCKPCGGVGICEHNKRKSECKLCGGSQICEHNKRKSECKLCGGSQICEHSEIKGRCIQCGGSQICEHEKRKSRCIQCRGSEICVHNKEKSKCPKCNEKLCFVRYHSKQIKRHLTSTRYEKIKIITTII